MGCARKGEHRARLAGRGEAETKPAERALVGAPVFAFAPMVRGKDLGRFLNAAAAPLDGDANGRKSEPMGSTYYRVGRIYREERRIPRWNCGASARLPRFAMGEYHTTNKDREEGGKPDDRPRVTSVIK
jgi:hypothetical protein